MTHSRHRGRPLGRAPSYFLRLPLLLLIPKEPREARRPSHTSIFPHSHCTHMHASTRMLYEKCVREADIARTLRERDRPVFGIGGGSRGRCCSVRSGGTALHSIACIRSPPGCICALDTRLERRNARVCCAHACNLERGRADAWAICDMACCIAQNAFDAMQCECACERDNGALACDDMDS
jgi:hypothetical protein